MNNIDRIVELFNDTAELLDIPFSTTRETIPVEIVDEYITKEKQIRDDYAKNYTDPNNLSDTDFITEIAEELQVLNLIEEYINKIIKQEVTK